MARGRRGPRATWTTVWPARTVSSRQYAARDGTTVVPVDTCRVQRLPRIGEPLRHSGDSGHPVGLKEIVDQSVKLGVVYSVTKEEPDHVNQERQ